MQIIVNKKSEISQKFWFLFNAEILELLWVFLFRIWTKR